MKVIARTGTGNMLKIGKGEKDAEWYFLDAPVIQFVKNSIKNGDEVTIKYNKSGGKATITYITKGEGESQQTPKEEKSVEKKETGYKCSNCGTALKDNKYTKCYTCNQKAKNDATVENFSSDSTDKVSPSLVPKCIDCGVALKDGKYQKCFKCNQKNPVSSNTGTAKDNLIKREAIGHMVSRSLISLQGQVDEKNIHQLIKSIYVTYLNLINQK